MGQFLYLGIGGIAGTFARYALTGIVQRFTRTDFPAGTLAVNLIGCFLIGFFAAVTGKRFLLTQNTRLLLITGFCGAFTTFSALVLETAHLFQNGQVFKAILYLLLSLAAGFLIFRAGIWAGEFF